MTDPVPPVALEAFRQQASARVAELVIALGDSKKAEELLKAINALRDLDVEAVLSAEPRQREPLRPKGRRYEVTIDSVKHARQMASFHADDCRKWMDKAAAEHDQNKSAVLAMYARVSATQAFSFAALTLEAAEKLGWYPTLNQKSDFFLSGAETKVREATEPRPPAAAPSASRRYFTNVTGYEDSTAYVYLDEHGRCFAVNRDGSEWLYTAARLDRWLELVKEDKWRELRLDEAQALIARPPAVAVDLLDIPRMKAALEAGEYHNREDWGGTDPYWHAEPAVQALVAEVERLRAALAAPPQPVTYATDEHARESGQRMVKKHAKSLDKLGPE